MADLNEMFSALERADAAGNVDDAREIAAMIRQFKTQPVIQPSQPAVPTDPNFKAGLLSGTTLPADSGPVGNRMIEDVGTPLPIMKELPKLDASKMPVESRFGSDFSKLLAGSAIPSVIGTPQAIESAIVQQSKSALPAPSELLGYLSSPDKLANKFITSLGFKPIFGEETKGLIPEEALKVQQRAIDEVRAKGKSQTLKDITEFGNKLGKDINATVSPEMQLAMANFTPTGSLSDLARGDLDKLSFGKDPSLQGLAGQFASVFGSIMPGMLGTIITKDPRYMTTFGFGQAGSEAVNNAREYIGSLNDQQLAKNSPYFKELIQAGYDPKTARSMTEEKAVDTAATAQGVVGMLGGDFTAKLITGKFDKLLLSSIQNRALNILARTGKGVVAGSTEEGIQEMAEGIASDLAIDKTVAKEIGADAFANLVLGALGGGGPGGVRGAIATGEAPKTEPEAPQARKEPRLAPEVVQPPEVAPAPVFEAVAPEAPIVAQEATPVPPETIRQDTGALDKQFMLSELDDIQATQAEKTSMQEKLDNAFVWRKEGVDIPIQVVAENVKPNAQGQKTIVALANGEEVNIPIEEVAKNPQFQATITPTPVKQSIAITSSRPDVVYETKQGQVIDEEKRLLAMKDKLDAGQNILGQAGVEQLGAEQANLFEQNLRQEVAKSFDTNGNFIGENKYRFVPSGRGDIRVSNDLDAIKSVADTFGKRKKAPQTLENLERTPIQSSSVAQQIDRSPSLRTELKRLNKMFEKGRISADIVANQTARLLDQTKKEKKLRPLERGKNIVLEKINAAVRRGELDQEALDFATWFISKNPNIADDIAISIKQPTETSPSGTYDSLRRLVRLYKESENNQTAVHEILHHTERLMPEDVQIGIRKLWLKNLSQATRKAESGSDQVLKDYFTNVLLSNVRNDVQAGRLAKEAIANGSVDYSNYQYFSPSEFWAVNATDIASKRFEGDKSFVGRLKQWLKEFSEKAKELFGLSSNAPIIRALDSLAKSDGKFKSAEMIGSGTNFENIKRTFKAKGTGQEVSPEKTPELYSWSMPEREDLVLGYKKDDLMYQFLDKQIDTKQMQEAILKEGRKIDDNFNAYQKETLYHGKVAAKTGDFLKGDVLTLVRDMNKADITLEQLEEYLHMNHAEERNDKMNERNVGNANLQDRGSGVSTKEAEEYFKKLSKEEKAKLEPLAKQVYDIINETQDILVRSGAEEKGLIDTWRKTYKKYVPLFREDDDFVSPPGTQMGSGFRVQGATSKRATGSTKKVSNILGNIISQRERAIVREEKMKVGRALYGMAIQHPNPDFWFAFNPDAVKSKKAAIEELKKFGVKDAENVMNLMEAPRTPYIDEATGQVGYRLSPITLQQHNAFPVRINGKDRYIFFNQSNPQALRMAKTLSEIDTDKLDAISNAVGKLTHWLAAVNTQYNPVFGVVNLIRDVKGAMYNLTTTELAGKQKDVAAQVMPSMNTIRKVLYAERNGKPLPDDDDAKLFIQFRDDGGQTGYRDVLMRQKEEEQLVAQELRKIQDPAIKRQARHIVRALSDFNDTMENSVRFAAYKIAIKPTSEGGGGLSRDKAAYIAKELTVNFDRKGNLNRRINAYFAFFNAAIRGSARIYETLTGPAGKKIMAGGVGLGVLQAAMLAGYPDDDPPEFVRERNFIIPVPGTKQMFTIPYPLGYHVFPGLGRITTEFMFGDRKIGKAVTDALSMFAEAFNPLGGGSLGWQTVAPTVLKLPAQVAQNKDTFGRPIYREDRATQPTPGYLRSRDTASTVSKFISEALNYMSGGTKYKKGAISPTADEIDFYAGQVTGGVGRELAKTKDLITNLVTGEETPSYRIPLVGRFYADVDTNASKTQRFYNNVVEMSNHEQEIKGRQKNRENVSDYMKEHPEARLWQQANNIENQLSAIKKERKALKERGASEDLIKRKNDQMIRLMDNFNNQVEKAKK
jgi:hypothetical protein